MRCARPMRHGALTCDSLVRSSIVPCARSCKHPPARGACCPAACRAVVTDLGAFVLINVYVPNAADEERRVFKCR